MKFVIITDTDSHAVEVGVENHLGAGWRLYGSLSTAHGQESDGYIITVYTQALTKDYA